MIIFFYVFASMLRYTGWLAVLGSTFYFLVVAFLDALGFRLNNDMDMLAFLGIGLGVGAYLLGLAWSIGTAVNRIK